MQQFLIENGLPVSIFVKISLEETDTENSPCLVASLFFDEPESAIQTLNVREIETMQQYIFDLPNDDIFVKLDPGHLAGSVNFSVAEDHELLLVRLASFKRRNN